MAFFNDPYFPTFQFVTGPVKTGHVGYGYAILAYIKHLIDFIIELTEYKCDWICKNRT